MSAYLLRLVFSAFEANDQRWILWLLRRLQGKPWLTYDVDECVFKADLGYPILFHWLLARLPERHWVVSGFLLNAGFDVVIAVGVWACAFWALPFVAPEWSGGAAAVAALAFLWSPSLLPPTARMMAFNGRAFGLLLYYCFLLAAAIHLLSGSWVALVAAGVVVVVIVLSSQFAAQATVAVTVGLTLWFSSWTLPLGIAAILGLSLLIPRLGVREPLRYFGGLYRWAYANRHRNTAPSARSRWWNMARAHWRHRQWRALTLALFLHSPPIIGLLYGVWVWAAGIAVLSTPGAVEVLQQPMMQLCVAVIVSMLVTTVVTGCQPFSIFGQAERYLEFAAAPAALVLAGTLFSGDAGHGGWLIAAAGLVALLVVNINIVTILVQRNLLLGIKTADLEREIPPFVGWLDQRPGPLRLLSIPMTRGQTVTEAFAMAGRRNVKSLLDWLSPRGEAPLRYMSRYMYGQQFRLDMVSTAIEDLKMDGIIVFKREGYVWDGVETVAGANAILAVLPPDMRLLAEDESYAVFVREDSPPAD